MIAALSVATALGACTGSTAPSPGAIALPTSPEALPFVDVAGYQQLLTQLHGTPVVVNVWASWCGPCNDEAPLLRQAAADQPNVQFMGVDIQDSKDSAIGFIRRHSIPYPSLFDPPAAIRNSLDLLGQPDTLFYDANGVLQATIVGPLDQTTLEQDLAKIAS